MVLLTFLLLLLVIEYNLFIQFPYSISLIILNLIIIPSTYKYDYYFYSKNLCDFFKRGYFSIRYSVNELYKI